MLVFLAAAQDSPKTQFTARELFYYAPPTATVKPAAPRSDPKPPAPQSASTRPKPVQVDSTAASPASNPARPTPGGELPGGGRIIAAAATAPVPTVGAPLGLKYTILKRADGDVEVAQDTVFHAGDHIRFNVETNGPGYLYIFGQGSSGTWQPMFPASGVADGNNRVEGFYSYTMPPGAQLTFDEQAGSEKVFIMFSREPEPDLEKVIYSLQGGKSKPVAQPSAPPPAGSGQKLIASAAIDNSTVGRMREAYARDLIVERVNEDTPGDRKEKAVYVVNPTGSRNSRVIADMTLVHK